MKLFGKQGLLDVILHGNGKAAKLEQAEKIAQEAHTRKCEALEQAGLRTAFLTQKSAEMAFGDSSKVDIEAILLEVEQESSDETCLYDPDDEELEAA